MPTTLKIEKEKKDNSNEEVPFVSDIMEISDEEGNILKEQVISINRCSKVVKGGRNFSFSAIVVAGDENGKVGFGQGKANEVSEAIRKGSEIAKKNLVSIPIVGGKTIPHAIEIKFRGARVLLRPASAGTGLIAGGSMRDILRLAGIKDVLAKSLGSSNPVNVVKATMKALQSLSTKEYVMSKRRLQSL